MAPKRRKVTRKPRGPWPAFVRKKAVELLKGGADLAAARKALVQTFDFEGDPPARSTLQGWARGAGLEVDVDPKKTRDTEKATEERLRRLDAGRAQLSELLLEKLSRPAAEEIARQLAEAQEAEEMVAAARQAYQDALKMVPVARDMEKTEPGSVKGAWATVRQARAELAFAMDFRIGVRDLVGIVTRSLGDHLALEGLGDDAGQVGDLIVEFTTPRPDRRKADEEAVPQGNLKLIEGGAK